MSHHIVEVKNLRHIYSDGTVALKDVSFIITHGESVGDHRGQRSRKINPSAASERLP